MGSIMKNLFTSHMRNPTATAEEDYIFYMQSIPGDGLKDSITGVPAIISISGTRYGIVNGVVTQFAVNQPPIEDDGLRGCPAFTQQYGYTETLSDALWTKNGFNVPVISGQLDGVNVTSLTETTATAVRQINQTIKNTPADNSLLMVRWVVKSDAGSIRLAVKVKNASTYGATFNLVDKSVSNIATGVTPYIHDHPTDSSYKVVGIVRNASTGATVPVAYIYNLDGQSYTGDGASRIYVSQPLFCAIGLTGVYSLLPYAPNSTSGAVSFVTETGGTIFDLDNTLLARLKTALWGPNAQGHLELTFKSNTDSSWWANGSVYNILSVNDTYNGALRFYKSGSDVSLRMSAPPTLFASMPVTISVGSIYKISVDWGTHSTGQKMMITVDGVKSALADFSGSFGDKDLRFFFNNTVHAGWIVKDSLKIGDKPVW